MVKHKTIIITVLTIITLSLLNIITNNNTIILSCSGSWNNHHISIQELDIELTIEIYEWLIANEDILFYEEE